ncbi:MAG: hypothetical protein J7603_19715, partial [Pseudacidovorax sp.]|nr:hypothetical protein [Pseudacidovorax sp.]
MSRLLRRYSDGTRTNHWIVALLFVCAGLTGLAFFHPFFWPLTALFGVPKASRSPLNTRAAGLA